VGGVPHYVVDDAGFRRHVEAEGVDRQVIEMLREQFMAHRDLATAEMLKMLGKDDLFTKAMIDASIKNMEQVLQQGLPDDARAWLGMLGFRVVIDSHGRVINLEMPEQEIDFDE
jgi:predicted RNA polymerase sigma factor